MNGVISFFHETYFAFCVIFLINTKEILLTSLGERVNAIFLLFMGTVILLLPLSQIIMAKRMLMIV